MVELADRTGNILTTIALFAIVASVAYARRTTISVFVLTGVKGIDTSRQSSP